MNHLTRHRGNGGLRENKVEKLAMDMGRTLEPTRHDHIEYTRGRCAYEFDGQSDARCVWEGLLLDGMCKEHREWVRRAARQLEIHRRWRARKRREAGR